MGKSKKRKLSAKDAAAARSKKGRSPPASGDDVPGTGKHDAISSKLKKLRGVAKDTPPPPAFHCGTTYASLSPSDGLLYEECLSTSYSGFHHETISPALQCQFDTSLKALDALYQYDGKDFRPSAMSAERTGPDLCQASIRIPDHLSCPQEWTGPDLCQASTILLEFN